MDNTDMLRAWVPDADCDCHFISMRYPLNTWFIMPDVPRLCLRVSPIQDQMHLMLGGCSHHDLEMLHAALATYLRWKPLPRRYDWATHLQTMSLEELQDLKRATHHEVDRRSNPRHENTGVGS